MYSQKSTKVHFVFKVYTHREILPQIIKMHSCFFFKGFMVWLSLLARSPVELGCAVSIISLYSVASSSTPQLSLTFGVCTVLSHGTICFFPMLFPFIAFVFLQYFCFSFYMHH